MNRHLRIAVADDEARHAGLSAGDPALLRASRGGRRKHRSRAGREVPPRASRPRHHRHQDARHGRHRRRQPDLQGLPDPGDPGLGLSRSRPDRARGEDHILAFLVKPIKQADLEPAIAIATRRFEQFQALRQEAADLRQALENRKLIERAKGLLMKHAGLDENAAFRRLQRLASERNCKLVEVAAMILTAEEAYQPVERARDKDRPGPRHPTG